MRSEISFDKVDLECAETVKSRTRINDSGFITYLNIMNLLVNGPVTVAI